jgi:hypothetical protein
MKRLFLLGLILAMLMLAGCGTKTATVESADTIDLATPDVITEPNAVQTPTGDGAMTPPEGASQGMGNGDPGARSGQPQLMVGMLGLEGTELALNATQATSILPALTGLQEEITAGSVTQEKMVELDAYIRSILSTEQIDAITAMDLTQESMTTILEPYGITLPAQMGGGNGGGGPQGTPPSGDPGGQGSMPQGTPPGGGGNPQGGGPGGGRGGGMDSLPTGLLEALIQLLQTRAAS